MKDINTTIDNQIVNSKCLTPKKPSLNQTYSIEEIDIDVKRPNIDDLSVQNDLITSPLELFKRDKINKQVFVEQAKVTITKQTISTKSTEIKTVKTTNFHNNLDKNLPKIIITDWDQNSGHQSKEFLIDKHETCIIKEDTNSFEISKQVSSKIVEEKTIDQFQDIDLFDQSSGCDSSNQRNNQRVPINKAMNTPVNFKQINNNNNNNNNNMCIDRISLGSEIKCKCCNKSTSSSNSTRGSYIIVKNTQPANVQFELFDSRLDETLNELSPENKNDFNKPYESNNYYLDNQKYDDVADSNNNDPNFVNRNLEISQNVFENDEYHLRNLKKLSYSKKDENQINSNFPSQDFEKSDKLTSNSNKKDQVDQFTSLNLSTYLTTGYLCCSRTTHSSLESQKQSNPDMIDLEKTLVSDGKKSDSGLTNYVTTSHIRSDAEANKNLIKKEPETFEYFYLYVSGNRCNEIFTNGKINLEKVFHDGKIIDAILLLTLPPSSSDSELLYELYGPNVPFDKYRVQCSIKLNRVIFDNKNNKCLIKVTENKYLCTKRIEFGAKFPKHEFRFRFNKS